LIAFHWEGEEMNELARLLSCWNDVDYLFKFAQQHSEDIPKGLTLVELVNQLLFDSLELDEILNEIAENTNKTGVNFLNHLTTWNMELLNFLGKRDEKII
jgi:hypothetical protein